MGRQHFYEMMRAQEHRTEYLPETQRPTVADVNILVVDDKQANLDALQAILQVTGYRIVCASSGEEALKCLLRVPYACCLLDIRMPGMNGFETARLIRDDVQLRHTPIIFVTAEAGDQKDIYQGYDAGAVDFLIKPLEPLVVRSKVAVFGQLYLQKLALQRSREIEILNRRLVTLNAALGDANRDLEHFTHIAAHDLREPLRRQRGMLDLLKDVLPGPLSEEASQYMDYINHAVEQSLGMIEDFRKLTKIGYGEFCRQETDLKQLIETCLNDFSSRIKQTNASIAFDTFPEKQWVYASLFKILYVNLIKNVFDHVHEAAPLIRFTAEPAERGWVFGVYNSGSSVAADQLSNIFKIFRKVGDAVRQDGSGVGLSICKRVIDRHRGRIYAESGKNNVHIKFTCGDENEQAA